jgi:hypothetical protein
MPASIPAASRDRLIRVCAWAGVAALVLGIWTGKAGDLRSRHPLPQGVKSPILALELIRSPDQLDLIARPEQPRREGDLPLNPPRDEPGQLAHAVRVDFAFIAAYATFLTLVGYLIAVSLSQPFGLLGFGVAVSAIAAAGFDVRENLQMLQLLLHRSGDPRTPSLWKWRLLFVAITCSTPVFRDRTAYPLRRTIGYAGMVFGVVAGVEGIFGAWVGDDKLIEAAAGRLGVTFLLAVLFLITNHVLRRGLIPALDTLASWGVLPKLAAWPATDGDETVGDSVFDDPSRGSAAP